MANDSVDQSVKKRLHREVEDLDRALRNSSFQLSRRDCERVPGGHDFTTSDVCRRCGYHEPFVYEVTE